MSKAQRLIDQAEEDAKAYRARTGCTSGDRYSYQVGLLRSELTTAYDLLTQASNPAACIDVEAKGIKAGALRSEDGEWDFYFGGQRLGTDELTVHLLDALCDAADAEERHQADLYREAA